VFVVFRVAAICVQEMKRETEKENLVNKETEEEGSLRLNPECEACHWHSVWGGQNLSTFEDVATTYRLASVCMTFIYRRKYVLETFFS